MGRRRVWRDEDEMMDGMVGTEKHHEILGAGFKDFFAHFHLEKWGRFTF